MSAQRLRRRTNIAWMLCKCFVFTGSSLQHDSKKWNKSGFRPPLCTYRLNWARKTSWGWWDDWDDTVLQTQDSKFGPWRSEAEQATSRSLRLPTILTFTRGWGGNFFFVSFKPPRPGTEPRTLAWKAVVLTTTLGPPPSARFNTFNNSKISIDSLKITNHYKPAQAEFSPTICHTRGQFVPISRHSCFKNIVFPPPPPTCEGSLWWGTSDSQRVNLE